MNRHGPVQPRDRLERATGGSLLRGSSLRFTSVELLIALLLLCGSAPFVMDLPQGDLIESMLLSFVMISAILVVGRSRRGFWVAVLLVSPALLGKWANHLWPEHVPPTLFMAAAILFFAFVLIELLRFLLTVRRVDTDVLCTGLCGYLIIGMVWIPAYLLVAHLSPGAFSIAGGAGAVQTLEGFNAFYFSFVTLCTVGYGDVAPLTKVARMLAVMQSIAGLFYVAVLMSRLVAIHTSNQFEGPADDAPSRANL